MEVSSRRKVGLHLSSAMTVTIRTSITARQVRSYQIVELVEVLNPYSCDQECRVTRLMKWHCSFRLHLDNIF
ncbi:unnamed protein product [Pieris brassicae]|uniref:Uncharacterized protein n=1 Tax=Pieris brassicae TaxID=7116 RepID=A0A9P0X1M5_PIEBR|nr:unnamed protein product [Pieris brassicae]